MNDLFDAIEPRDPSREVMADGAMLLRGSALPFSSTNPIPERSWLPMPMRQ